MILAIDYDAIRKAIVRTAMAALGLDQNHVIMSEPEIPNSPRPSLPYLALKVTTAAARYGDDFTERLAGSSSLYNHGGQRLMVISFHAYGATHEEAYGLMALWQARLEQAPTQAALRAAGIAVWLQGAIMDLSALQDSAYEGRAQMDVRFGIASNLVADLGQITQVIIDGTAQADVISGAVLLDEIKDALGG
jgi:hypothetical protein